MIKNETNKIVEGKIFGPVNAKNKVGLEIDMNFGDNLILEVNIDKAINNYREILTSLIDENPEIPESNKIFLDSNHIENIKGIMMNTAINYLGEIAKQIMIRKFLKQPTTYEEEKRIVVDTYNEYIEEDLEITMPEEIIEAIFEGKIIFENEIIRKQ